MIRWNFNIRIVISWLMIFSYQALYMLEFLELNNLLGVSHFTFYNHTIGPKATCVINHYMEGKIPQHFTATSTTRPANGDKNVTGDNLMFTRSPKITVDLLPWNLKMKSQKEIRTEGLFASLNDCLYRSMYRWWLIGFAIFHVPLISPCDSFFFLFQIFSCCANWFRWIYYSTT